MNIFWTDLSPLNRYAVLPPSAYGHTTLARPDPIPNSAVKQGQADISTDVGDQSGTVSSVGFFLLFAPFCSLCLALLHYQPTISFVGPLMYDPPHKPYAHLSPMRPAILCVAVAITLKPSDIAHHIIRLCLKRNCFCEHICTAHAMSIGPPNLGVACRLCGIFHVMCAT